MQLDPDVIATGKWPTLDVADPKLRALGLPVVCVDARQAHRALSGRLNKSDPADAEGLAQLAGTGWYRAVHVKSLGSDRLRALLGARDRLIRMRQGSRKPDPRHP